MTEPNWNAIAEPDASVIGDPRSCANCMHRWSDSVLVVLAGSDDDERAWKCHRTGWLCCTSVSHRQSPCGPDLKLWTPRPVEPEPVKSVSWWRRLFNLT